MSINIQALKNGFTVTLTNPGMLPESYYVATWELVVKMITGLQIADKAPLPEGVVPMSSGDRPPEQ